MDNFRAGDTFTFEFYNGTYSSADYDMWIAIRGNKVTPIDIQPTTPPIAGITFERQGNGWKVTVADSITKDWEAGDYDYAVIATATGEKHTMETGTVTILPDISAYDDEVDNRSMVKQTLDAVEAAILARASGTVLRKTVNGITFEYLTYTELLMLRDKYTALYSQEERQRKIDSGIPADNKIRVRF